MEETLEGSIFNEEITIVYGGFWERFGALFLDGLILAPVTILNWFSQNRWNNIWLMILCGIISLVYKPFLEYQYGATPGKKALSLRVVNQDYGRITADEAILRNIFGIVLGIASLAISLHTTMSGAAPAEAKSIRTLGDIDSGMLMTALFSLGVCVLYLADAICLIANSRKQSLHDLIAKTYVIRN